MTLRFYVADEMTGIAFELVPGENCEPLAALLIEIECTTAAFMSAFDFRPDADTSSRAQGARQRSLERDLAERGYACLHGAAFDGGGEVASMYELVLGIDLVDAELIGRLHGIREFFFFRVNGVVQAVTISKTSAH